MVKVFRHGETIVVSNPVNGQQQRMVNVTFIEEGRSGGDVRMSDTTSFLNEIAGEEVGLTQVRIHTHPILESKLHLFPIGKEFRGHINRGLYSTAQLRQQRDVDPRIIDGRPTYFRTWISDKPEEDVDMRMSNEALTKVDPTLISKANVGATEVRRVVNDGVPTTTAQMDDILPQ